MDNVVYKTTQVYETGHTSFEKFLAWTDEKRVLGRSLIKRISEDRHNFLDIGGGIGELTKLIAPQFAHTDVVEPGGDEMITQLEIGLSSVSHTITRCGFEDYHPIIKYDLVLASHSFRYIQHPHQEVRRIRDTMLTPHGQFILIDISPDSDEFWQFYLTHESNFRSVTTHVKEYDYTHLLHDVFPQVSTQCVTTTLVAPSVDQLLSIMDFIYDVPWTQISDHAIQQVQTSLENRTSGLSIDPLGRVWVHIDHTIYLCSN